MIVWKKTKKKMVPKDQRLVKSKWVFKIKRNGIFRARLVACGYTQIPGVDFTETYAPVIHNVTFRIMIVMMILLKLVGKLIDIETAFLYGDLDEEIYMECPAGLEHDEDEVLLLLKPIYGLIQVARQFYKKWKHVLEKIGFESNQIDPCLFSKKKEMYIGSYVDDNITLGTNEGIAETIKEIEKQG